MGDRSAVLATLLGKTIRPDASTAVLGIRTRVDALDATAPGEYGARGVSAGALGRATFLVDGRRVGRVAAGRSRAGDLVA